MLKHFSLHTCSTDERSISRSRRGMPAAPDVVQQPASSCLRLAGSELEVVVVCQG